MLSGALSSYSARNSDPEDECYRAVLRCCESAEPDPEAFQTLFKTHAPTVLKVLRLILRDQHLAEDALQDTFLRFHNTLRDGTFEPQRAVQPFLLTIARNVAVDVIRSRDKTEQLTRQLIESGDLNQLSSPSDPISDFELRQCINHALNQLTPEDRTILVYRYVEKLKLVEIAEILHFTERTAHNRLKSAAINFQSQLSKAGLSAGGI